MTGDTRTMDMWTAGNKVYRSDGQTRYLMYEGVDFNDAYEFLKDWDHWDGDISTEFRAKYRRMNHLDSDGPYWAKREAPPATYGGW